MSDCSDNAPKFLTIFTLYAYLLVNSQTYRVPYISVNLADLDPAEPASNRSTPAI